MNCYPHPNWYQLTYDKYISRFGYEVKEEYSKIPDPELPKFCGILPRGYDHFIILPGEQPKPLIPKKIITDLTPQRPRPLFYHPDDAKLIITGSESMKKCIEESFIFSDSSTIILMLSKLIV